MITERHPSLPEQGSLLGYGSSHRRELQQSFLPIRILAARALFRRERERAREKPRPGADGEDSGSQSEQELRLHLLGAVAREEGRMERPH